MEITVALTRQLPWLPNTLLFEHRSITEIIDHIEGLGGRPATTPEISDIPSVAPSATETEHQNGVAVVGMSVRCGDVGALDELWTLLSTGSTAVMPVPPGRGPDGGRTHYAALVNNVDLFDADFFGISPREAEFVDPQLRLILEATWGALEDAGSAGLRHDADTGVFVGAMYSDYLVDANAEAGRRSSPYRSWEAFSLANRVSQILNLRGPSLAVNTACSSSGTALHLACNALRADECSAAVVAGVNLILDPQRFSQLDRLGILSPSGRCQAFGSEADGTVLGEGVGVVILRSLDDAKRRGDRIYGVIKGTGISSGTGTVGFTAPNPKAQAAAIRRAVRQAGIDPRTVSYVETHGTGTPLGDPIEVRGLTLAHTDQSLWDKRLSGTQRCALGSIKPNIGHLEAGAGILGLIKVLLQLTHGTRVPSLTSPLPNPAIPFDGLPFEVQRALDRWEPVDFEVDGEATHVPRRAGVSSFGVGGANAHAIVEERPPRLRTASDQSQRVRAS